MIDTAAARFRQLLARPGLVEALGSNDVVNARLLEQMGFECAYVGGHDTMAPAYGLPDIGLVSVTEMIEHVRRVTAAVDIPIFMDLDDGGGSPLRVARNVRLVEKAGVAGLHIEDNDFSRGKHFYGSNLGDDVDVRLTTPRFASMVRAAADARRDPDTLIVARTDAATSSYQEAVDRCCAYAEAGADMVFPCFLGLDDVERFVRDVPAPVMLLVYDATNEVKATLARAGVKLLIYPTFARVTAFKAVYQVLREFRETGQLPVGIHRLEPDIAEHAANAEGAIAWAKLAELYSVPD